VENLALFSTNFKSSCKFYKILGGFVMAFFEELGKKISKAGHDAAEKGKSLTETVRLNGLIAEEERRIKNDFSQIGKLYYEKFGDNPEPCFVNLVEDIRNAEKNMQNYTLQIRQAKGVAVCSSCGSEVSTSTQFCSSCGASVTQTPQPSGNVCVKCNGILEPEQVFCMDCGTKVESPPPVPVVQEESAGQPTSSES